MPTLDNQGVNIYYETVGSARNPTIIFNHGNGNSLQNWRDFDYITPLKEHFYLVLVDARGFGNSDKPHESQQYTAEKQTSDFIAILDALQIAKAHYFGNSRGGRMAYTFQALHPDRFLSFTISGADPAGEQLSNKFITWLHQGMEIFVQNLETEIGIKMPPELRRTFLANDPLAMIAANASTITYPNAFEHSDTPCLVIVGDQDPIYQAVIASMSKIKNGQLKILPGLNHAGTYMQGSTIAALIREFIFAET